MKMNLTFLSCLLMAQRCPQAGTGTLWKQCHLLGACLHMAWLHQDTKGERSHTCCSLTQLLNTSEGQTKARREGQCFCRGPRFKFLTALLWKAGIGPQLPPAVPGKEPLVTNGHHTGNAWSAYKTLNLHLRFDPAFTTCLKFPLYFHEYVVTDHCMGH